MTQRTGGQSPLKTSVAVAFLLLLLFGVTIALSSQLQSPNRDFIEYWSSAKLLAQHANPYDPAAILRVEKSQKFGFDQPLVMGNPPTSLILFAPLGYLPYGLAASLWEMLLLLAALGSIRLLQPFALGRIPMVAFFLAAVIDCVLAGQSAILVLLGISLFIRLQKDHPFWAGLALTLGILKPHLLSLFWLVLLFEVVRRRRFRIVVGGIVGFLGCCLSSVILNPHIWSDYRHDLPVSNLLLMQRPNVGTALRMWVWPHGLWLQFVPLAIGVPLGLWFWWRTRHHWEWHREGAMIIAGAVLASPYSFHVDQVLFVPAVLFCYPRTTRTMQGLYFVLNALALGLILKFSMLTSMATVWTAPVWVAWFITVYRQQQLGRGTSREAAPELAVSQA